MKIINIYSVTALAITAAITTSLAVSCGDVVPAGIFAALLMTILVLGWAGGASAAKLPDRLTDLPAPHGTPVQHHFSCDRAYFRLNPLCQGCAAKAESILQQPLI